MSWFLTNLIGTFLLPPLNLLLLGSAGLLLWHKKPRLARTLMAAALILLWLCSTPFFAEGALHQLEKEYPPVDIKTQQADAIVVLGGGTYFHPSEYTEDTVSAMTLERLRYAAKLHRETAKPILATGGKPRGNELSEAQQMKEALETDFRAPVRWIENGSDNTIENARYSYRLLQQAGIRRIYLVTHAWHMPRAAAAFRRAGFDVVPAPTAYTTRYQIDLLAFIPRAESLRDSKIYMHELIGLLWYKLKS